VYENSIFWGGLRDVVIDHEPICFIQSRLESQIGHPASLFSRLTLLPEIIIVSFQADIGVEKVFRQALQQDPRNKAVQVTFMRDDHFRPGQRLAHCGRS